MGEMILLYKYMYKIRLCMWLTETLCAALSCSLCLFLFLSSNVIKKTTASQNLSLNVRRLDLCLVSIKLVGL